MASTLDGPAARFSSMTTIRRIADSCLTVETDQGTTLFDPGFFPYDNDGVDLEAIGDIQRVLITHEHGDHVKPEFVRWLVDRGSDVQVYANPNVAALLAPHDIETEAGNPDGVSSEDVVHGMVPSGQQPPNRSWTIDGIFTHPGDSHEPSMTAPVLALPCLVPWGSMTASIAFAKELSPTHVIPIHDFYLSELGRGFVRSMATSVLSAAGIEVIPLAWGESCTV